jgi:hypothetical protein
MLSAESFLMRLFALIYMVGLVTAHLYVALAPSARTVGPTSERGFASRYAMHASASGAPATRFTTPYLAAPQVQAVANETPGGALNGKNAVFTLAATLYPASLLVFRNGLLLTPGVDYALAYPAGVPTLTFAAGAIPQPGDVLRAYYQRSL